jgi:hypothetical protein
MALQSQSLATGVIPTTIGTLLAIGVDSTEVHSIILVNTDVSPVTVNLFLKRAVDPVNRRIFPKDLVLPANAAYYFGGDMKIYTSKGDLILGIATSALVDYVFGGLVDL